MIGTLGLTSGYQFSEMLFSRFFGWSIEKTQKWSHPVHMDHPLFVYFNTQRSLPLSHYLRSSPMWLQFSLSGITSKTSWPTCNVKGSLPWLHICFCLLVISTVLGSTCPVVFPASESCILVGPNVIFWNVQWWWVKISQGERPVVACLVVL